MHEKSFAFKTCTAPRVLNQKIILHFLPALSRNIKNRVGTHTQKKTWCSCYYFMLRIWRGVHNVVSRTPLWLLRKLQLRASYSNSNPCGTYILTDAGECTFQLSFQEAHISLGRASLAASAVLVPRQVMPQRNRGR